MSTCQPIRLFEAGGRGENHSCSVLTVPFRGTEEISDLSMSRQFHRHRTDLIRPCLSGAIVIRRANLMDGLFEDAGVSFCQAKHYSALRARIRGLS
jgi:hypothetical protein